MDIANGNKFNDLKRKIYLTILPILLITNIFYCFYSPNVNRFMEIMFLPTCLIIVIFWAIIYKYRHIRFFEIFTLIFMTIYHLIRIHTMTVELSQDHLNVYMFWSPIYFVFIFLVLERKKAFLLSGLVLFTIIMMTAFIVEGVRGHDIMIQYYLSILTYILILYYFRNIVSAYIESDMLKKNAYYDYLTNIGNRRSVDTWLENEMKLAYEKNASFSIIYFDIDHFKNINDVYGHDAGDYVLKELSALIKNRISQDDYFGRWGGEEFILISPNKSLKEAAEFAEVLRKTIENHPFQYVEHITSSFGVTEFQRSDTPKSIINRADKALYVAKSNGRNIVSIGEL